jgi:hypothetical protein
MKKIFMRPEEAALMINSGEGELFRLGAGAEREIAE